MSTIAIASVMWKISIMVVTPHQPCIHVYHDSLDKADVVLVHNGKRLEGYTLTRYASVIGGLTLIRFVFHYYQGAVHSGK